MNIIKDRNRYLVFTNYENLDVSGDIIQDVNTGMVYIEFTLSDSLQTLATGEYQQREIKSSFSVHIFDYDKKDLIIELTSNFISEVLTSFNHNYLESQKYRI